MDYHFVRNLAILALAQVMVIVAGVLAAGACCKWYTTVGLPPFDQTVLLAEYGFLALIVPSTWITVTMTLFTRREWAESLVPWAWKVGVVELILMVVFGFYAAAMPWLRLFSGTQTLSS